MRYYKVFFIAVVIMISAIRVNSQEFYIRDCGVLYAGVEAGCVLIDTDHYGDYLVGMIPGTFEFGDHVFVAGEVEPGCYSFCMEGDGCLWADTMSYCDDSGYFERCGILLKAGEANCQALQTIPPFQENRFELVGAIEPYEDGDTVLLYASYYLTLTPCMIGPVLKIDSVFDCTPTGVLDDNADHRYNFCLDDNYPNPFNPATHINYAIGSRSHVDITVYNVLGQKITTLVSEEKSPGEHSVRWGGTDDDGNMVKSGIYFYRIKAAGFTDVKKMIFLR
jgi:hypothetical protein